MAAGRPAENAELVLQADDVHVADVEEVRGAQIRRQVLLLDLEANHLRVLVAALNVVDRHAQALALRMRVCDGGSRSDVNVAMPHLRGRWSPTKAILRIFDVSFEWSPLVAMLRTSSIIRLSSMR